MTPDIIKAIADILDLLNALNYHGHLDHDYIEDEDIAEAVDNLCARGDDLSETLGLVRDSSWEETATALRALARPEVGLPEGWAWDGNDAVSPGGPNSQRVAAARGFVRVSGDVWPAHEAPESVVRAVLLRAAGVAS